MTPPATAFRAVQTYLCVHGHKSRESQEDKTLMKNHVHTVHEPGSID